MNTYAEKRIIIPSKVGVGAGEVIAHIKGI
jgi:hypothetical protein